MKVRVLLLIALLIIRGRMVRENVYLNEGVTLLWSLKLVWRFLRLRAAQVNAINQQKQPKRYAKNLDTHIKKDTGVVLGKAITVKFLGGTYNFLM